MERFWDFDTSIYDIMSSFIQAIGQMKGIMGTLRSHDFFEHFETTLDAGGFDKAKVFFQW